MLTSAEKGSTRLDALSRRRRNVVGLVGFVTFKPRAGEAAMNSQDLNAYTKDPVAVRNVFACLVHERPETIVDLVRNLRKLDPASAIILYNGGRDPGLLDRRFTVSGEEPLIHPRPRLLEWGALDAFALDCLELAEEIGFDALTIVDSDQLALREGYSDRIAAYIDAHPRAGLLGIGAGTQGPHTRVAPAVNAWKEVDLWRPFLQRFPRGEELWTQWTFWPSTVITASAARDLVWLFRTDQELAAIMARSHIWATEEIVIPTLVAALGYEIAASPCSYDFVRYRARYGARHVSLALARDDVFWMHPVPRRYDDPSARACGRTTASTRASKEVPPCRTTMRRRDRCSVPGPSSSGCAGSKAGSPTRRATC